MFAPTADRLYGAGPTTASPVVAGMPADRAVKAGHLEAVPSPDAAAAPKAADSAAHLVDDPTFWLVATIAGVLVLASTSA